MKTQPELSPAAFEELKQELTAFSLKNVEALRLVLVEGKSQSDAAKAQELSKQTMSNLMRRVREIIANVPKGWVRIEEYAPPEMAERIKSEIAEERKKLKAQHQ